MTDIFTALGLTPPNAAPAAPPPLPPEYETWIGQHPPEQQAAAREQATTAYKATVGAPAPVGTDTLPADAVVPETPVAPPVDLGRASELSSPRRTRGRPSKSEALQIIIAAAPSGRTTAEIRELIELAKEY